MSEPEVQLASAKTTRSFRSANAPGISWLLIIFLLVLLALSVIVFGKDQPTPSPTTSVTPESPTPTMQSRVYTVTYDSGVFSPTNLRIHAGDTVRFKNNSIFPIHITSSDVVGFDSTGDIPQGSYFSFTFAAKGEFTYHNSRNPSQKGTIIVR